MKYYQSKLVTIVTEASIENQLMEELEEHGVRGYTVTSAHGKGSRGLRDASWEVNTNIRIEIICDLNVSDAIIDHLKKNYSNNYAMVIFIHDVDVLRLEKFSNT